MDAMRGANIGFPSVLITVIYLIIAVIYFFPIYYLYNFSVKMKKALLSDDQTLLRNAFEDLKSHYKFVGIFTIVILSLYLLMFLIGLGAAASIG